MEEIKRVIAVAFSDERFLSNEEFDNLSNFGKTVYLDILKGIRRIEQKHIDELKAIVERIHSTTE